MIPVPLLDLKFLNELAARAAGTSNRRHWKILHAED
jgi:nitroreductase